MCAERALDIRAAHWRAWLCSVLLLTALALRAEGIVVRAAQLEALDDGPGYQLNAYIDVTLPLTLEEALANGIALNFIIEFDLWRERAWWFDKREGKLRLARKLTYNSLTRQYRVAIGGLYQNFFQLGEALRVLGRVRGAQVTDIGTLQIGRVYEGQVSMMLDVTSLPKAFQISALASADWHMPSTPFNWVLTP